MREPLLAAGVKNNRRALRQLSQPCTAVLARPSLARCPTVDRCVLLAGCLTFASGWFQELKVGATHKYSPPICFYLLLKNINSKAEPEY